LRESCHHSGYELGLRAPLSRPHQLHL
jgi:hypothetical protein